MRIVFRADASPLIGTGHVMRSSVLAEEAISRGHECIFVGSIENLDWVEARISGLGFSSRYKSEGEFRSNNKTDLLILDSYTIALDSEFIRPVNWAYILSISDDVSPAYFSDVELHPDLEKSINLNSNPQILSGPDFILIRSGIFKSSFVSKGGAQLKVLLVGGGADSFGFSAALSDYLATSSSSIEIHCFSNDQVNSSHSSQIISHPLGPDLDIWANRVDLVFTTASTSSFEFIAREVPMGVVCAVGNQRANYDQLGRLGVAAQIGTLDSQGRWNFDYLTIKSLLENSDLRTRLKLATEGLVDLSGASRVIDFLEKQFVP